MMIFSGLMVADLQSQSVDSSGGTCLLASETPEDRQGEWNVRGSKCGRLEAGSP